jgi:hypothetical protein
MKVVVNGYLEAMNFHSKAKYKKRLNQLNKLELMTLKNEFPLNITIMRRN